MCGTIDYYIYSYVCSIYASDIILYMFGNIFNSIVTACNCITVVISAALIASMIIAWRKSYSWLVRLICMAIATFSLITVNVLNSKFISKHNYEVVCQITNLGTAEEEDLKALPTFYALYCAEADNKQLLGIVQRDLLNSTNSPRDYTGFSLEKELQRTRYIQLRTRALSKFGGFEYNIAYTTGIHGSNASIACIWQMLYFLKANKIDSLRGFLVNVLNYRTHHVAPEVVHAAKSLLLALTCM